MEKSIESERTGLNFTEFETTEIIEPSDALKDTKDESQYYGAARIYAKPLGGIAAMLALLALPALTLPGFAIFVLIGEIFLIDWTYSQFSDARSGGAKLADTKALEKDARPEDEIDK
ncbi:MAG: hypothetical protein ACXABV_13430, partial [Candidatus Thorarchaeota archaeon]